MSQKQAKTKSSDDTKSEPKDAPKSEAKKPTDAPKSKSKEATDASKSKPKEATDAPKSESKEATDAPKSKSKKSTAVTSASITSGDGKEYDLEGQSESHIGLQPGAVVVEVDPKSNVTDVKGAIKTHALMEKGAQLVEMDPKFPTNYWSNEHDTAFHVQGSTKPKVLVNKGAVLVEMNPKETLNFWTNETGTAYDVQGDIKPQILVNKGVVLVELSAPTGDKPQEVTVRGRAQSKALLQTASVQLVSADADAKEADYDVSGVVSNMALVNKGAVMVEARADGTEINVHGATTKRALIKSANVQIISTDGDLGQSYDVSGSVSKVALVEQNAKLVSMNTNVTTNYWTDDKETVYDIAGGMRSNILLKQGATLVEMNPSVVLNYWTHEVGASYDTKGDIKKNILLKSAQLVEVVPPDAITKGAALIEIAKDSKAAGMEVEVKETLDDVDSDINLHTKRIKDELNEDIDDGMKRSLQVLVDLNNEMASFEVNCNKLRMDKIGRDDVEELINGGSVLHRKLERLHEIIRAIKVCSDGFIRSINGVEEYIETEYIPNVERYKDWNINDIVIWIKSLDNGRFVKYIKRLENGFRESEIGNGEILPDLETADLSVTPFNIKNFKDKRDLIRNFKSLRTGRKDIQRKEERVVQQQDIMALIYESQKSHRRVSVDDFTYQRKQVRTLNFNPKATAIDFQQYHD